MRALDRRARVRERTGKSIESDKKRRKRNAPSRFASGQIRQTTELFICSELTRMKGVISSDYPCRWT